MRPTMLALREALEASWDERTSYQGVSEVGNPALGQCYPTSWVLQQFFPTMEIVQGQVQAQQGREGHFWNLVAVDGSQYHVDLTWSQFPAGSMVQDWAVRDRRTLGDSQATIDRCQLLLDRVRRHLAGGNAGGELRDGSG